MEKVKIEINREIYDRLKSELDQDAIKEMSSYSDFIGCKIFIRTVTYHLVGKVVKIIGDIWFLENASWIPDSGRFSDAIKTGEFSEIEPVGDWFFNVGTIVDGCLWIHSLPTKQK